MKIKSVETESPSVVIKDTISSDRARTLVLERELLKERKITEGTGKKADYW